MKLKIIVLAILLLFASYVSADTQYLLFGEVTSTSDSWVNVSGDTMTGNLIGQNATFYNITAKGSITSEGKIIWGDGTNPTDTNLYRGAANLLKTDDDLTIYKDADNFVNVNDGLVKSVRDGVTRKIFQGRVSSGGTEDTNPRFNVQADGKILWGDGTAGSDVNLYRSKANVLYTADNFSALNLIDRTPYYDDGSKALMDFANIKGDNNGSIDHSTLPAFLKVKVAKNQTTGEIEYGRSVSNTVSMLIAANLELERRIIYLQSEIDNLKTDVEAFK